MRPLILASALLCQALPAQISQPQPELSPGSDGTWNVQWWGIEGRSYFLQASDDLEDWHYAPVIEAGNDEIIEYETGSLGSRHFLRLAYVNQTAGNLDTADFDNDNLGNLAEINVHHTDPLKKDSDEDGMPDGWEINHGLDPNDNGSINAVNGPNGDGDGDGIPNLQEFQGGTDPVSPGSFPMSLIYVEKTANQYFPAPGPGTLSKYASWLPNDSSTDTIHGFLAPQDMVGAVEGAYAFPDLPSQKATTSPVGGTVGVVGATYSTVESGGDRTAHGYVQQGRFWLKATPVDIAKGRGSQKYLKVIDRYTGSYSGQQQQLEPLVSVEKLEAKASSGGYSEPLDLKPEVVAQAGDFSSTTIIRLIPVNIEPIEGMAGVVGDMVPSNRTENPELHFVTPKKTAEIPEDYVTFTATGITEQQIANGDPNQIEEWDGGQAVLNEPLKRKVSRAVAEKTPIRIKTLGKFGGQEIAKLNVWVVWCSPLDPVQGAYAFKQYPDFSRFETNTQFGWMFVFQVSPKSIVEDADRPDLEGLRQKPVPGAGKPYVSRPALGDADTAERKWDVSRQMEVTIKNPNGIRRSQLGFPQGWYLNQPENPGDPIVPVDVPEKFPQDPVEGNDDAFPAGDEDEDCNPYQATQGNGLTHAVGELSSFDAPSNIMQNNVGVFGDVIGFKLNFREFVRLQIWDGKRELKPFWFRISDYVEWHHFANMRFIADGWYDSAVDPSGNGFGYKQD